MLFHIFELYFIVMYTIDGSLTFAIKNVDFFNSVILIYSFTASLNMFTKKENLTPSLTSQVQSEKWRKKFQCWTKPK